MSDINSPNYTRSLQDFKFIGYRMRSGVKFECSNGSPALVLSYPLKFIFLNRRFKSLFEYMDQNREFLGFEQILARTRSDELDTEKFLNMLVRSGFLEMKGIPEMKRYPTVSIIIPVRNRAEEIVRCLDSLLRIEYPPELMDIIVVDDASTDETPQMITGYPVTIIPLCEHKKASYCRNQAALQARGEILAFIDSDCIADAMWLRELLPAFNDESVAAIGGFVDSYYNEKNLDKYEKVKSSLIISNWFKRSKNEDRFFYVPSCNLLVRKDIFLNLNGFNEDLVVGEDVDLCWRLQESGFELEYRPLGKIFHKHRNNITSFAMRRYDYGTSEPILQELHPDNIKKLELPIWSLVFWIAIVLAVILGSILPFSVSVAAVVVETFKKKVEFEKYTNLITFLKLGLCCTRNHVSFLIGLCSFISRYYLIALPFIAIISYFAALIIISAHLASAMIEFALKKPRLNFFLFLFFFTIEQVSYQSGVWVQSFKKKLFNPVFPNILIK